MADDAVREQWRRGRARYAVWLVRVDDARVAERLRGVADALARWVDPDPVELAHVTVFVSGFPAVAPRLDDDVAEAALDAQVDAARGAGAVRLAVGGVRCFRACAYLAIEPGSVFDAVRARLQRHCREIRFAPFVPHLTIGPFRDGAPPPPGMLAELPPIELAVDAIELVELDATRARAPFRTRATVELLPDREER